MSRAYHLLNSVFQTLAFLIFGPTTIVVFLATFSLMSAQISSYIVRYTYFLTLLIGIGWLLILYLMIVIHELGHVIAALILRWHIQQVCIGPLTLTRQDGKFKLKRSAKTNRNDGYGGYVWASPSGLASASMWGRSMLLQYCFFTLGGVIANLCVALLSLVLLFTQTGFSATFAQKDHLLKYGFQTNDLIASILIITFLLNLFYVFVNLIPIKWSVLDSDGKSFITYLVSWILGATPPVDKAALLIHELLLDRRCGLGGRLFTGRRPKEWDAEKLASLQDPGQPNKTIALGKLCAYYSALDQSDIELASTHLNAALELKDEVTGNDRSAIFLEAAYFEGFHRHNPVAARRWLHQVKTNELQEYTFLRGAAAVLLAEGLYPDALASASAAYKQAKASSDGAIETEKEWLKAIIGACKKRVIQDQDVFI
jgi:hypothetical protein